MAELDKIFDSIVRDSFFKNKSVLQSNYTPETIPHRNEQVEAVASILAPALRGERASNLFIYGKTGCISGESHVFTSNGWKKIKEADSTKEKVLSFNKITKNYEWSDFVFLKFENKDKLLKIKLDNGYELIATKDHPLLLSDMSWKKADELKQGECLTLAYNLPNLSTKDISPSLARLIGFTISDGSLNKRERRVKDSRGHWYNSNRQRFRYFNKDKGLLDQVKADLSFLYNYTPSIIYPKNRCEHINVISQQVCSSLCNFGIPFGNKSAVVEVPCIILGASSITQREFLKALFSGDGSVSTNTYMIEYYSNSLKLLQQISYLLHQEGIVCKIKEKRARLNGKIFNSFRLYICGQSNLVKFYHKIGFYSAKKQQKLKEMLKKYVKNRGFNEDNYVFSHIKEIEEIYEEYVYDLNVPNNHNFIANGIISHNTGKTLSVQHVGNKILERLNSLGQEHVKVVYVNCKLKKVADTEYRILAELIKELGGSVPATGLPTDAVYSKFVELIDNKKQVILIILDEIDQAVQKINDSFIYTLTRINSSLKNAQISIIGISNSLTFMDNIDPRVRSSLGEEELVFPPYNALQLQDILKERADKAFKEGVLDEGVIAKCAAYAAREHGDARRALDLLRVAGELAEREKAGKISFLHIDGANQKIERDKMLDIIESEPKQFQFVLYSIMELGQEEGISTGDVYNKYQELCERTKNEILTQRRVSDILNEFDMLGLINARVVSKGRQGRTREIKLMLSENIKERAREILEKALL